MAKKKVQPKRVTHTERSLTLINVKVSGKDRKTLITKARKYTDGNVSAWIRRAGLNYKPAA